MEKLKLNKAVVVSFCVWIPSVWQFLLKMLLISTSWMVLLLSRFMVRNTIRQRKTKNLTLQIFLGFNITFYLNQVTAKGIYTFKEIAHIHFPRSLEDLPSLFTLINIKSLLEINHIFWSICKKSQHPDIVEGRYKATQMSLDTMIDPRQDSTRQCVLRFGQ